MIKRENVLKSDLLTVQNTSEIQSFLDILGKIICEFLLLYFAPTVPP